MRNLRSIALCAVFSLALSSPKLLAQTDSPCGVRPATTNLLSDVSGFGQSLHKVPRESVQKDNLKWELPVAAAVAALVAKGDRVAADQIQSPSLQQTAGRWTNIGLGMELGTAGFAWLYGCGRHHPYAAESGFSALEAVGLGLGVDLGLKAAFNRQYPYSPRSTGEFWEGGKSFPSGHTVTSWAFASVMAHRYPHNPWIKWGSYAVAAGISIARYPAKKHFPSDIVVGAPIGYLIGRYIAGHESQ